MAIDPEQLAKNELSEAMIPTPDDVVNDLSPLAALYYLEQLGWATLNVWTAYAQEAEDTKQDGADDLAITLQQVASIVGSLDATCARIGLIPADAIPPTEAA